MSVASSHELGTVRAKVPPRTRRQQNWFPFLLSAPALLALIGVLYPFFTAIYYSLTDYRLIRQIYNFIGFQNYLQLLRDSAFLHALGNTLLLAGVALIIELPLGFGIALLLSRPARGIGILRSLLLLPLMLPPVITGFMWKAMLAPDSGLVNMLLSPFGLKNIAWLSEPLLAWLSILFIEVWVSTPFVALILLSGIQALPKEPFEAADVDGAPFGFIFRKLMLPMLKPFIILVLMFRIVDVLKLFDVIFATTGGGPLQATETLSISVYKEVFQYYNLGYAIAKIMVLFVINYVASFFLASRWRKASTFDTGVAAR
ncbi:MAG TPA: sugar ABC transporter permease [Firmicutes bacterium]|nr:sugar ABC transporter permease [Bacillota bacterium]